MKTLNRALRPTKHLLLSNLALKRGEAAEPMAARDWKRQMTSPGPRATAAA
jgi:hypothetical protein